MPALAPTTPHAMTSTWESLPVQPPPATLSTGPLHNQRLVSTNLPSCNMLQTLTTISVPATANQDGTKEK